MTARFMCEDSDSAGIRIHIVFGQLLHSKYAQVKKSVLSERLVVGNTPTFFQHVHKYVIDF